MITVIGRSTRQTTLASLLLVTASLSLGACSSGSSNPPPPPPPPPPASVTLDGVVSDGPVSGGTIFVFAADMVQAALDAADASNDRLASLGAADSLAALTREAADADQYAIELPGDLAGTAVFLVFDSTDAEDAAFSDTPPNLESVAIVGDAGSVQTLHVTMQTSLIASAVRTALDPDGDGTVIDATAIANEIDAAKATVVSAFRQDAPGRELYDASFDPLSSDDTDTVHTASSAAGVLMRAIAMSSGGAFDDALQLLADDLADGSLDDEIATAGRDEEIDLLAAGPCSSAAVSLRHACAVDVFDDVFESTAICLDIADEQQRADCVAEIDVNKMETVDECEAVFEARLALCANVNDSAHEPLFGPAYAANFVDPLEIGNTVAANPWFPLVTDNRWLYEGDGETIEVIVTDETKLIDGVTCVVVVDTVTEDGELVELTQDWYAQDTAGNVWYCGEIARNYELFAGDNPEVAELVDIEGSWKAGRDGAEPGILFPFDPQVGEFVRQEILFGEAEDYIQVLSLTASESSPGGSCNGTCLQTLDGTPLEPDAIEHKFFVPGLGQIVETNPDTGERIELTEATLN